MATSAGAVLVAACHLVETFEESAWGGLVQVDRETAFQWHLRMLGQEIGHAQDAERTTLLRA